MAWGHRLFLLPSRLREGSGEGLSEERPSVDRPSPNPSRKREGNGYAATATLAGTFARKPSIWQIAKLSSARLSV
ncbi:hypothetical protein EWE75_06245 [Sphingomonas populi]|uniref:Uncharacterized protein n=1 Tax=Sphingomonas populi TaxID=2484750 RepID=A0A4Q6Y5S3_9SPHN|nr:hypothetical protein EWE75_06245 [Sphingomonas populi]